MTANKGTLRKLSVTPTARNAEYTLELYSINGEHEQSINLNEQLNTKIALTFNNKIVCIYCQRVTSKSYSQGYCYPCAQKLARCDLCIVQPRRCHYHLGTCREPKWGEEHCFQSHIVYLANSAGLKVGITRNSQVPTRWYDQGAIAAIPIYQTQSRYQAGLVEGLLAQTIKEATNWRKMLTNENPDIDLEQERMGVQLKYKEQIGELSQRFEGQSIELLNAEEVYHLNYPVLQYPDKVKSLNLDKTPKIEGILLGIKGQYIILDSGVLNIRKYTGYEITFEAT